MSLTRREWLEIAGAAAGLGRPRRAAAQASGGGDRSDIYPGVERLFRSVADDRAATLTPSGAELRGRNGVLVQALDKVGVTRPMGDLVEVPPDGLLWTSARPRGSAVSWFSRQTPICARACVPRCSATRRWWPRPY